MWLSDMNILQVSTRDVAGGAERIAWDLFQGIKQRGHVSHLAVCRRERTDGAHDRGVAVWVGRPGRGHA